jgi:hypothetical protein
MSWKQNKYKREFFLTHTGSIWECTLCKQSAFKKDEIEHKNNCVFNDESVTGIRMVVMPERDFDICDYCTLSPNECPVEIGLGSDMATHEIAMKICSIYRKAVDECGG